MVAQKNSVKVLLIDGNTKDFPAFLRMMATAEAQRTVDRPLELLYTDTLESGLRQITKGGINLVLLGHPLEDKTALDKIREAAPQIPVVAIAAHKHEKLAIEAVKNGAKSYLLKGKNGTEALSRLIEQI